MTAAVISPAAAREARAAGLQAIVDYALWCYRGASAESPQRAFWRERVIEAERQLSIAEGMPARSAAHVA